MGTRREGRKKIRWELYAAQNECCYWCGIKMVLPGDSDQRPDTATMDHLIPRSKGGPSCRGNYVVACRTCNSARGCNFIHPLTKKPLFFVTTNLLPPNLPSKGFKIRNFILINYHKTPALGFTVG